jgi:hypothetical protein
MRRLTISEDIDKKRPVEAGKMPNLGRAALAAAVLAVLPACGEEFATGGTTTSSIEWDGGVGGGSAGTGGAAGAEGGAGGNGGAEGGQGGGGHGGGPNCVLKVLEDPGAVSGGYVTPGQSKDMLCVKVQTENCPATINKVVAREIYGLYGSQGGLLATGFLKADGQIMQQNVTGQDVPGQHVVMNFNNLNFPVPADVTVELCTGGVVKNSVPSGQSEHMEIPKAGVETDPVNDDGPYYGPTISVN